MALKTTLKNVATKLIAKFGRDVTHIELTDGTYNPDAGSSKIKTQKVIKAFISSYRLRDYLFKFKLGDAPMITTTEIKHNDEVIANGKHYRVTQADAIPMEDGIVMYQCNLRGLE